MNSELIRKGLMHFLDRIQMNAIASHVEEQISVNRGHMVDWDLLWHAKSP